MNEGVATFFAPITLLIGGGLFAFGFLSIIGLQYFKTPLRGQIAMAVGLVFLIATESLFVTTSGSGRYFSGQQRDLTDCELQVEEGFPLDRTKKNGVIGAEIRKCMDKIGYDWIEDHDHCKEARLATNAFCYLPRSKFDRTLVAFQMQFE